MKKFIGPVLMTMLSAFFTYLGYDGIITHEMYGFVILIFFGIIFGIQAYILSAEIVDSNND